MNLTLKKSILLFIKIIFIGLGLILLIGIGLVYLIFPKPQKPSVLTGKVITVQGVYIDKGIGIFAGRKSFDVIKTKDGREIKVIDDEGYNKGNYSCVHGYISYDIQRGDLVEVRGAETADGNILHCGSEDYYAHIINIDEINNLALDDAANLVIQELTKRGELEQFKKTNETDLVKYHLTLGMWIRNELINKGVVSPDVYNEYVGKEIGTPVENDAFSTAITKKAWEKLQN